MAMIMERAGGLATNGSERLLDVQPEALHQRTPVFMGSREYVELVHSYLDPKAKATAR
jgi:fructose-1,6-bisphosphatase I